MRNGEAANGTSDHSSATGTGMATVGRGNKQAIGTVMEEVTVMVVLVDGKRWDEEE